MGACGSAASFSTWRSRSAERWADALMSELVLPARNGLAAANKSHASLLWFTMPMACGNDEDVNEEGGQGALARAPVELGIPRCISTRQRKRGFAPTTCESRWLTYGPTRAGRRLRASSVLTASTGRRRFTSRSQACCGGPPRAMPQPDKTHVAVLPNGSAPCRSSPRRRPHCASRTALSAKQSSVRAVISKRHTQIPMTRARTTKMMMAMSETCQFFVRSSGVVYMAGVTLTSTR